MSNIQKSSMRNGRCGSCIHNQSNSAREKLDHIDHSRTKDNLYYAFDANAKGFKIDGNFDLKSHEVGLYRHFYGDGIHATNERYIKKGKQKNCRSIEEVYSSDKHKPMETIFQFSNSKSDIPFDVKAKITWYAAIDTISIINQKYGTNIKPLSICLHNDESVSHIHFRYTIGYKKNGLFVPNQTQALNEMGFKLADGKKATRYDNALILFTDATREIFYQRCEVRAKEFGLDVEIDRNVVSTSKRHEKALKGRVAELEGRVSSLLAQIANLKDEISLSRHRLKEVEELLLKANKRVKNGIEYCDQCIDYTNDKHIALLEQAMIEFQSVRNELQNALDDQDDGIDFIQ